MEKLHEWFQQHKREFPWRMNPTPYQVWISEVMLQQTRAVVVVPYFEKWMDLFPNVNTLATAPLEKIIKTWEGLGYYSRARNLHKGAQYIVTHFGGELPSSRKELEAIPGLGPYTVGAILSFGFQQRAAAVDGNVLRVLTRYLLIEENVCKQKVRQTIVKKAEELLDREKPWVTAEALIELGATICTPKPKCTECPLQRKCQAYAQNKAEALPIKNEEKAIVKLSRSVVMIEAEGHVLVKKGQPGKVMADLYEFPYFEGEKNVVEMVKKEFGLKAKLEQKLSIVNHTFTRYKAALSPYLLVADRMKQFDGYEWLPWGDLLELPFSAGHRRILLNYITT